MSRVVKVHSLKQLSSVRIVYRCACRSLFRISDKALNFA